MRSGLSRLRMLAALTVAYVVALVGVVAALFVLYQAVSGGSRLPTSLVLVFPEVLIVQVIENTVVLAASVGLLVSLIAGLAGRPGAYQAIRWISLATAAAVGLLGALSLWLLASSPALSGLPAVTQTRLLRIGSAGAIAGPIPWIVISFLFGGESWVRAEPDRRGAVRSSVGVAAVIAALSLATVAVAAVGFTAEDADPARRMAPANPDATPEARAVLEYLYAISGKGIIAGQHNTTGLNRRHTELVNRIAGAYPALWGSDFSYGPRVEHREAMVKEAIEQWRSGSLVTIMYHAPRPMDPPTAAMTSVRGRLSDAAWKALVTPGTELHRKWLSHIDHVAAFLAQLRDAGVPVLWRPYHEMNGEWFWWGGRPGRYGSARLWRLMYDRFVNHHQLDNLVWVWSPGARSRFAGPFEAYYPGHSVVDVIAMDTSRGPPVQADHDELHALSEGKPIALGETGPLPDPVRLVDEEMRWVWFMQWHDFLLEKNDSATIRDVYAHPYVVTRDDLRLPR